MSRLLIAVFAAALLSACAAPRSQNWVRAWPGENDLIKDHLQCDYEAEAHAKSASAGLVGFAKGWEEGSAKRTLKSKCMAARGWRGS